MKVRCFLRQIVFCLLACIASLSLSCQCKAQTQLEMNESAIAEYKKEDAELNKVYNQIKVKYKDDPIFLKRLKEVQQAWIVFRDAEIEALYPTANNHEDKRFTYGSVYPMCRATWLSIVTSQRIKELKRWLQGTEEGDVCCGSVKWNSK